MIRYFSYIAILLGLSILFVICSVGKNTSNSYSETTIIDSEKKDTISFPIKPNSVFVLNEDIDLGGKVYKLPRGVTIKQTKGVIKNGTLIGYRTEIDAKTALFENVSICGSWNVPVISTDLFKDLNYTNSLKDVIALSNHSVRNDIYIKPGDYIVSVDSENQSCLKLTSNTNIYIEGQITLLPNPYAHYNIIHVIGENICISGTGTIIGDKDMHTGTDGEWGMGVRFSNARNCSLLGLNIKNCWGDCVYIGGNSSFINVKQCTFRNGRRQGISITSGNNISIEECEIYDISGTNPMYAIDIEPNRSNIVDSVFIRKVKTYNCKGGIMCTRSTKSDSSIGYVEITNCVVSGTSEKYSYRFKGVDYVVLKRCQGSGKQISFLHVKNVIVEGNSINNLERNKLYSYSKCNQIKEK